MVFRKLLIMILLRYNIAYFREWQIFENFEFLNFRPRGKRIRKKQLIKEHSANVSVKINGKTGRSQCKNCCY